MNQKEILVLIGYNYSSIKIEMYTPVHQSNLPAVSVLSEEFDLEKDEEKIGMTM